MVVAVMMMMIVPCLAETAREEPVSKRGFPPSLLFFFASANCQVFAGGNGTRVTASHPVFLFESIPHSRRSNTG